MHRELVHGAVRATLDVEVTAVGAGHRVHRARSGGGVAQRVQGTGPEVGVPGQGAAARVGGVEQRAIPRDPAGRHLPGGRPADQGELPVVADGERGHAVGPGLGHGQVTARVEADRERDRTRVGVDHRGGGRLTAGGQREHVDVVAVALGRDDQLAAVRGERDLARGAGELGTLGCVEAERPIPGRHPDQRGTHPQEALHRAAVAGVEHVDDVAARGHADRERAAGADDLVADQVVPVHFEHRHRVAARVDRVQQAVLGVVGE